MKAGRELDALIAEKVMGWAMRPMFKAQKAQAYDYKDRGDWVWVTHYEQEGYEHLIESYYPQIPEEEYESGFHPSAHIADAWLVVEKLGLFDYECLVKRSGQYQIGFYWWGTSTGGFNASVKAATAPLAICLAALKAVEDK